MVHSVSLDQDNPYAKKILVVDDYSSTRQMIVDALHQCGYMSVQEADNGREALNILKKDLYDLVISDVMMPYMNGMDLLRNLKELQPDTAVIMITGQPATDLTVSAMKKGAVDLIKKPFNISDLLYKVQIYLREKSLLEKQPGQDPQLNRKLSEQTEELSVHSYIYDSLENLEGENEQIFDKMSELAIRVVEGEVCHIVIYDDEIKDFYKKLTKKFDDRAIVTETYESLKPFLFQVIKKCEALLINSDEHPEIAPSLICTPLTIRGQAFGVLCIRKKKHRGVFNNKDLHYITSLTKRASLNLENKVLYESLYANVLDTFKSLIASIQLRDQYTEKHCHRVTKYAIDTAVAMGCSRADIESLKISAALHDIGKIAIPDAVLLKNGRLTDQEYEVIKTHSDIGERIIHSIALFDRERAAIRHHHERWDGRGYPQGLQGEEIPLLARIIAVADTYDAIMNDRPYRPAQSKEWALEQLEKNRGTQFDGQIVDCFLRIIQ
ncbi:MAG: response regulator [Syntrophobacterales bacterium]|nr:response regulator [Syntrophobacterales bacterium]